MNKQLIVLLILGVMINIIYCKSYQQTFEEVMETLNLHSDRSIEVFSKIKDGRTIFGKNIRLIDIVFKKGSKKNKVKMIIEADLTFDDIEFNRAQIDVKSIFNNSLAEI